MYAFMFMSFLPWIPADSLHANALAAYLKFPNQEDKEMKGKGKGRKKDHDTLVFLI